MKEKIKIMVLISSLFFMGKIQSQNVQYFGLFPTIDHSAKLTKRLAYNVYLFDAIKPYTNRINAEQDRARSLYIYGEAGLSYSLTKRLSITAAYVHERQNPFLERYRTENRLFQQLTLKLPIGKNAELKQRLRFDERFIKNQITLKTPFTHRLRYLLGIKQPFAKENLYLMGYSEAFFNTSNAFKFDENWTAIQLGVKINNRNFIESGLLFVGWINNAPNDWLNQYYWQTTWVSQLDFTKPNK